MSQSADDLVSTFGSGCGREFDGGDVDLEDDFVADQEPSGLQGRVPVHAPVLAVDRGAAFKPGAQVAERVLSPKLRALFGWFCCVSCAYGSLLIDRCSH